MTDRAAHEPPPESIAASRRLDIVGDERAVGGTGLSLVTQSGLFG